MQQVITSKMCKKKNYKVASYILGYYTWGGEGVTNYQRKNPVRNHHGLIKSVELQGKIFIW